MYIELKIISIQVIVAKLKNRRDIKSIYRKQEGGTYATLRRTSTQV
jgi:hypothetical protein